MAKNHPSYFWNLSLVFEFLKIDVFSAEAFYHSQLRKSSAEKTFLMQEGLLGVVIETQNKIPLLSVVGTSRLPHQQEENEEIKAFC